MVCMDYVVLVVDDDIIIVISDYEYIKGFGDYYLVILLVMMCKDSGFFDIEQYVKNLFNCVLMIL